MEGKEDDFKDLGRPISVESMCLSKSAHEEHCSGYTGSSVYS